MAGFILPQTDFAQYENPSDAPSAPVIETIHVKSEHDTAEGAEKALLERYIFRPDNSPYRTDEEQSATAKESNSLVTVRRISKQNIARSAAIRQEIDLLWSIPHPIIPDIYEWLETPESLYFIQDNRPRRSLRQLIEMSGPVPDDGAKDVMTQLFTGIAHLFLHHVAPMRITPDILLFDSNSNLVLGNFESAVRYSEVKEVGKPYALVTSRCGDDIYTAPEEFEDFAYNARKAVVWSCGVVLYYMVTAQTDRLADLEHPSTVRSGLQAKRRYSVANKINKDIPKIINYPTRSKVPSWALTIIPRMLIFDPARRPELIEVASRVPKLVVLHASRPLMELAYLDYKYNVGPVGPPIEELLKENNASSASSIFGASSIFSSNSLTGLLGRRKSER